MSWTCEECQSWVYDKVGGHCGLHSSACAQDIWECKYPPREFIQMEVEDENDG